MRFAVGAYSGPRAVCGAVAQLANNAIHVIPAIRRMDAFVSSGFIGVGNVHPPVDAAAGNMMNAPRLPRRPYWYVGIVQKSTPASTSEINRTRSRSATANTAASRTNENRIGRMRLLPSSSSTKGAEIRENGERNERLHARRSVGV